MSMMTRRCLGLGVALLLMGYVLDAAGSSFAFADGFVLIRNARNSTTSVSRAEIKDMAVGKKKVWGSGAAVQVVLGPTGSGPLGWFASLLGVPESTLMSKIRQEVFKGEMKKPIIAASEQECLAAVGANLGAFGIVSAATAQSLPPDVAILSTM